MGYLMGLPGTRPRVQGIRGPQARALSFQSCFSHVLQKSEHLTYYVKTLMIKLIPLRNTLRINRVMFKLRLETRPIYMLYSERSGKYAWKISEA